MKLTPTACCTIRASPGPGAAVSSSVHSIASGPPAVRTTTPMSIMNHLHRIPSNSWQRPRQPLRCSGRTCILSTMSRTIGCFLVELLAANDIDTVFGIPGVHNLELYRGLTATPAMRHVLVRHEQGAGFAADGFARLSGRPAAAFVISGPGLTNILTAAAQAYSDSVPMLIIASSPVRASLGS